MTNKLIPCFVPLHYDSHDDNNVSQDEPNEFLPPHPAVHGVELLSQAFSWIDAFGPILEEIESTCKGVSIQFFLMSLFSGGGGDFHVGNAATIHEVLIGVKKRHEMVRQFTSSLEGEICQWWPIQDRMNRFGASSVHFEEEIIIGYDENGDGEGNDTTMNDDNSSFKFDAKNLMRLSAVVERCILARVITCLHLYRNDPTSAMNFVLRYTLATAPAMKFEQYPKLPPVQSVCLMEAMLMTRLFPTGRTLLDYFLEQDAPITTTGDSVTLFKCVWIAISTTADIFKNRTHHEDPRISEIGRVHVAAYQRLKGKMEVSCKPRVDATVLSIAGSMKSIEGLVESSLMGLQMTKLAKKSNSKHVWTAAIKWILPLLWTLEGGGDNLRTVFMDSIERFVTSQSECDLLIVVACAKAIRELEIRSIDNYGETVASPLTTHTSTISCSLMKHLVDSVASLKSYEWSVLSILLSICNELSDGESGLQLMQLWYENNRNCVADKDIYFPSMPMVRVINLQRRQDRMASFMSEAMSHRLLVMRGVILPKYWHEKDFQISNLSSLIGTYAIDGSQGSPAEVERKLMNLLESTEKDNPEQAVLPLETIVARQWCPNELRIFDRLASKDDSFMVSLSPSEKACALSHISTWKGIISSISAGASLPSVEGWTRVGFARGEPLHTTTGSNSNIGVSFPPTPVAMVLEDDAILVDRFMDRLDEILQELPRDFHYCALGYGKPKEAPLVDIPGCKHVKIPTMTWYLTGYLLSAAGARYLLDHLPVVGPVDAWMGRKMIMASNWENDYGHRVGVGMRAAPDRELRSSTLTKKELQTCLRFRAFCANIPLCHQKVRTEIATGAGVNAPGSTSKQGQHWRHRDQWRHRDTDIVYSGNISQDKPRRGGNGD